MEVLVFLVPLALFLSLIGLIGFLWSLKNSRARRRPRRGL